MNRPLDDKSKPREDNLGFGIHFSPTMATSRWTKATGWSPVESEPRKALALDPAAMVLHYGQAIFEGLKGLHHRDAIRIFRPESHARRFQRSAARMCMPELPVASFLDAVKRVVLADHELVPPPPGCMYLRPTMIATEAALGVRAAEEYLFFLIASPSGAYYRDGAKSLRIWVERHFVRAARGGLGSAKASANYAASLLATRIARQQRNCDQVLWLDSERHREIEELGAGNVFFVWDGDLVTPDLGDSVLDGVTRDCLLAIGNDLGLRVRMAQIEIDEAIEAIKKGRLTEMFTCGTAAVITPVGFLVMENEEVRVGSGSWGPTTRALWERLTGILHGQLPDTHGWFVQAWPEKKG